ncbi:MAG: tetratricopeptide repeat protein [Deltaproteobacteria bacterium]|nr:tetratricopeptide repeat protein [Deltaproteobacteria bacterium]
MFLSLAGVSAREAAYYQKELSPGASRVLMAMQECSRQGQYEKGLQQFRAYTSGSKSKAPVLLNFMAANLDFQLGQFGAAAQLYRLVVAAAPDFNVVYENLGMALMMAEQYKDAAEILLQAAALLPEKETQLKYQAAVAYLYGEDFIKARALLLALVSGLKPAPADWLKALLQVHWRLEQTREALAVAARLVDSYPEEIEHWRLYGQIALAAQAYETALSAYKVIEAAGRMTPAESRLLAGIYQQLQLPAAAAQAWERVFAQVQPTRPELLTLIALYQQSGQIDNALKTLDRLEKIEPAPDPDNTLAFRRAQILYRGGRYQEAYPLLTKIKKLNEDDGYQFLLAGYCAWNENDFSGAAAAWRKAAAYAAWRERSLNLLQSLKPWLEPATAG